MAAVIFISMTFAVSQRTENFAPIAIMFVFFIIAPVLLAISSLQKGPNRVLLLRPFHDRSVSTSLKALAKDHLAPFGPVFTLADADIEPPGRLYSWARTYLELGRFLTNWLLPAVVKIESRSRVETFASSLQAIRHFTLGWLWSRSGLCVIRTSDRFWKDVVKILSDSVDLIVLDLSEGGPGTIWEIDLIRASPVRNRVVCVAMQGRLAGAQEAVSSLLPPGFADRFFGYSANGKILRETEFNRVIGEIIYKR